MSNKLLSSLTLIASLLLTVNSQAQQVADTDYKPPITKPAYQPGKGPLVLIDEAHFNFHTATGRYLPFAELLRRDGYVVKGSATKFTKATLQGAKILVIANALNERNGNGNWTLPTPSAFTDEEVAVVREWVQQGGSLLLIADHMPFPGAAEKLGAAFDIRFTNGYVRNEKARGGGDTFARSDSSLKDHAVTNGRNQSEKIDSIMTFTGSAFQIKNAEPLIVLGDSFASYLTQAAGQFPASTPREPVNGWYQGAVFKSGKGRVAVFGEAAMFSAQLRGPNRTPMGMNAPEAKQNYQFLLNVMHWLSAI